MLDKMYEDFTTKFLPSIQEGLVITKEYFIDLFGRYVKYLIVSDSIDLLFCLVLFFGVAYIFWKFRKFIIDEWEGVLFMLAVFLVIPLIGIFTNVKNIIKDIYIPEIRVYEELKDFKK